jgi:cellobiose phosphorylase
MHPPYVDEGDEVGRIANLEPGTFENGSVYQHAVTFHIFALLAESVVDPEKAFATFAALLPTNPENFDCRRTSEPYCTGNYYCGPSHKRFGQNFFTWFTGNASWLLRAGFDEILGVKADFDGLRVAPKVPKGWREFSVVREFRDCVYEISFFRVADGERTRILVDGKPIEGNLIPIDGDKRRKVIVEF